MERVTKKDSVGHYYMTGDGIFLVPAIRDKFMGEDVDRVGVIEDIIGNDYDLDRLRELVQADRDGRCVVLPQKTVFELTWDAGPDCDMICPLSIDGEGQCDFCDNGKLFVYERQCKQEHIDRIGRDVFLTREAAEDALKGEQDA